MTREDKILLAIEKGFTYNAEKGIIYGVRGQEIVSTKRGYIRLQLHKNCKKYELPGHCFAWYVIHKEIVEQIDHINCIRTDNRICNLRVVTKQQNQWNKKGIKGYYFNKNRNKYQAVLKLNNKQIYLGLFNTEKEASDAYLEGKKIYHII